MVPSINRLTILLIAAALSVSLAGCQYRKPKDAIPVVGPPPPRYSYTNDSPSTVPLESYAKEESTSASNHQFVSASLNNQDKMFKDTKTVAYVNGEPILASEILEPYLEKLAEIKAQVPPEQYNALKMGLMERDLPIQIDNRLLIQGFKSTLKKPQQEALDKAIAALFTDEIEKLKAQFEVNTDYELEVELQKKNSSLSSLERAFGNRVMAAEYLKSKAGNVPEPTRQDLIAEYNKRKQEEFFRPARVRWQQILTSYGENGGKQGAVSKLTQAANDLKRGVDFTEIAKTYSNGPGAEKGGYWDWMQRGSLADQSLEEALFTMPVGQISDVFVSDSGLQIVRVLERERAHYIPFEDVQDDLKDEMTSQFRTEATDRVMKELREQAVIKTIFDEPETKPAYTQQRPSAEPISQVSHNTQPQFHSPSSSEPLFEESPIFNNAEAPEWARDESTSIPGDNPFQPISDGNPFE